MRALLKHSINHPNGKLKPEIPEPEWLADPSHRTKVVAKPIFALANAPYIYIYLSLLKIAHLLLIN